MLTGDSGSVGCLFISSIAVRNKSLHENTVYIRRLYHTFICHQRQSNLSKLHSHSLWLMKSQEVIISHLLRLSFLWLSPVWSCMFLICGSLLTAIHSNLNICLLVCQPQTDGSPQTWAAPVFLFLLKGSFSCTFLTSVLTFGCFRALGSVKPSDKQDCCWRQCFTQDFSETVTLGAWVWRAELLPVCYETMVACHNLICCHSLGN